MPDQVPSNSLDCVDRGRRSLLIGLASLAANGGLGGCAGQGQSALAVRLLSGSVPPQILAEFQKTLQSSWGTVHLQFAPEAQLQTLFTLLQTWQRQGKPEGQSDWQWPGWVPWVGDRGKSIPDLVMLGNYWLPQAIQQGLIQPLDPAPWKAWGSLVADAKWQTLVTRNDRGEPDPKGKVWAAPYRWGSTMIAYRRDIFQAKGLPLPTDWSDLWRSDLKRQISLLDQPREVIGLTLKKLGHSYNTANLKAIAPLEAELQTLHQQVKLYSSSAYLQPLLLGDTWAAVGWSTDILPLIQRNSRIAAIVPRSGTALWADLWVCPRSASPDLPLVNEWINFCWQPQIAERLSLLSQAASPVLLGIAPGQRDPALREDSPLLPSSSTVRSSEFLQPLSAATVGQYQDFWARLRTQ